MLVAVLRLIGEADDPAGIVGRLMAACAPGSFLTISHPASDLDAGLDAATRQFNQSGGERATNRDRAAVTRLFGGCELVEPGVVQVAEWRPDSEPEAARHAAVWAGVAGQGARRRGRASLALRASCCYLDWWASGER
jgi:hypothetical protein